MNSAYKTDEPLGRVLQIRFPERLMDRVDAFGNTERMPSRSAAVRILIEKGLENFSGRAAHKEAM